MTVLTLSNCYTPIVVSLDDSSQHLTKQDLQQHLVKNRSNGDGQERSALQLRRLHLAIDISSTALGSSLVELGHSKVLCHVTHGDPNLANVEEGVIDVTVDWIPNIGFLAPPDVSGLGQHTARTTSTNTMSVDLAAKVKDALLPAMAFLQNLPKTVIAVTLTILQDDGCILSACVVAASLALSNASLELFDLVTSCTVCCMEDGVLLVDPTMEELRVSSGSLTLTMLYSWKEVTLWQQTGVVTSNAMDVAREGCQTMSKFMRECLL